RCTGQVEVKHEGQWGTVCSYDFHWDVREASVVCRQLGCGTMARAFPYTPFGAGAGRIWLQPFFCHGTETALHHCPHYGSGQHYCDHNWDIGVTCSGEGLGDCAGGQPFGCVRTTRDLRLSPLAGFVRLVSGDGACSGRVEVRQGRGWATLCKAHVDLNTAHVICKELGCG
ncbi:WC11 protein, partial [Casuarius casuarius]|nr:WC11 protein [Casuarius casuarius]